MRTSGLMPGYLIAAVVLAAPALAQTAAEQAAAAVDSALSTFCTPFLTPEGGRLEAKTGFPRTRNPLEPTPAEIAEARRVSDIRMAEAGMVRTPLSDDLRARGWV